MARTTYQDHKRKVAEMASRIDPETVIGPKVAEGAPSKARRYLTEGRLSIKEVRDGFVIAHCRGDGEVWTCGFGLVNEHRLGWWCECPARTSQCAHLRALRLVVDRPTT